MGRRLAPNSDAWGGSWGSASAWGGSFGWSWGPLHEVEEEQKGGGGSKPFNGKIPKTEEKVEQRKPVELPKFHPWIHSPIVSKYVETVEPEIIEAVIEVVAKTVEKRTVQDRDLETERAEKEFRLYLEGQQAEWKEMYSQLIRLEYERHDQEYEDAQIAMLLFEM